MSKQVKKNMWKKTAAAFVVTGIFSSCSVGPDYEPPKMDIPEKFQDNKPLAEYQADVAKPVPEPVFPVDLSQWWKTFNDPVLSKLIDEAVKTNLSVRLAEARVREARALLMASRAPFFPVVSTFGNYLRSKTSKNAGNASTVSGGSSTATTGTTGTSGTDSNSGSVSTGTTGSGATTSGSEPGKVTNLYTAGFDASWEIDIFGGTRRAVEAAEDTYNASVDAKRNAMVTLLSEVAQNYIRLRGSQNEFQITQQNAAAQRETLDLQRMRTDAGIDTDLTVAQAESQLHLTESKLPTLETPIRESINRLSVLMDKSPGALTDELIVQTAVPKGPAVVPAGIPSELLKRRPDVSQAENVLAAATANIGVAVADFYPKLTLDGTFGLKSRASGNFSEGDSKFWSFGPTVNWGILDFYAILSNIDIQDARQEQALIEYRQVVLSALEEADNAIVAYQRERDQNVLLQQSVDSSKRALQLATDLHTAGVEDFLNVLNAQQVVFQAEDTLSQSDQSLSTSLVALYKALGGGWDYAVAATPAA